MKTIALRCPHCGRDLPAAPERRIFSCDAGHGAFHLAQGALRRLETELVLPEGELPATGDIVLLPIWVLSVDPGFEHADSLPLQIRVPAIGWQRLPKVMEFARNLTRSPQAWNAGEAEQLAFDGATIEAADAMEIGELVALGMDSGWPPDAIAAELEIPFVASRLCLLPAHRFARRIETLVGGVSCPDSHFDDSPLSDRRSELARRLKSQLN